MDIITDFIFLVIIILTIIFYLNLNRKDYDR